MKKVLLILIAMNLFLFSFSQQAGEKKYRLMEFQNANISSVLNYVSDITGMTIIPNPNLKGNVTIINKEELSKEQIIAILYSTLRDLGYTIERQNNILTVVPLSQEQIKTEIRTDEDISKLADGAQIITYIITLKVVNAESIINNIRPFVSLYGKISINQAMNKIIITDAASNIKKVFQLIKELDKQEVSQGKDSEIIYLKHISVDKMESIILDGFNDLKIIDTANPAMQKISPRSGGIRKEPTLKLIKMSEANAFIAIGGKEEIENLKNFIKKIDIEILPAAGNNNLNNNKLMIIPLKYLNPKKMIELINQIFVLGQPVQENNWRREGTQQMKKEAMPLNPETRVMEFPERNSLIFIGLDEDYKKIMEVVNVFEREIKDTGYKAGEVATKVFQLQNQKADDIVQIFKSIYSSSYGDKQPAVFYAEKNINCIVVSAPSERIYDLGKLLNELDKKLSQVLIKVLIVEVSFSDQSKVGVDWNQIVNLPQNIANGAIPPIKILQQFGTAPTSGFTVQSTGLNFILNALGTLGTVNVLSTPHILTLDNKEAVINIGKKVAFITETISITGADQNNITTSKKAEYRDVGLKLTVKPQINDEKTVTLDVTQEVNDIEASGNVDYPNIITREIRSTIMAGDNQTAVLGGLMSTKETVDANEIPFLGRIPILGYLFKSETKKKEKTELVLFITPYVVVSSQDLSRVKEEEIKQTPSFTPEQLKEINREFTNGHK